MTSQELIKNYLDSGYRLVFWPAIGDTKGPREEGWTTKVYTLNDYHEGYRVGMMTGVEVQPGIFNHDVDIDWAPGSLIAQSLLPPTGFVFGRLSKPVSHAIFGLRERLPSFRYEDIDGSCFIEFRGTKSNGDIGMQTMVPPSIWSKDHAREPLVFVKFEGYSIVDAVLLKQRVCLSAIGMIFAKHLGLNGFGHETRLAWAGFLLRANIPVDDIVTIGEAMSVYCNNREIHDVRRAVESTAQALQSGNKKVKGGPALAKILGIQGKQIFARVNSWLGRDSDFIRKDGVILAKNQDNIRRAIELLGYELSYDEFAEKPLLNGQPFNDNEIDHIELQIDTEYHFQPPEQFFQKVITHLAWTNKFHPVKQYLAGLIWDQAPRIDTWIIQCAGALDNAYTRAVSRIMLIAAVRRVKHPGCKYDEMVVWESDQGAFKSSAAQALCPNPSWFSDDLALNLRSQQLIEATLGKWIMEASDLAGKRKTEIEQLKAMLSRQVDGPARMAYAHFPVERPRHFIIIGTTNSHAYLTDPTGARRFWPITVKPFDIPWIKTHRDQLWAEAVAAESTGESIRLHESLWPTAAEHQEARREIDPWEPLLRTALLSILPSTDGKRRVVTSLLWDALGISVDRRDRYGSLRISDIMQRFGFKRTRVRPVGGEVEVGFMQDTQTLELEGERETLLDVGREPGSDDPPF